MLLQLSIDVVDRCLDPTGIKSIPPTTVQDSIVPIGKD